MGQHGSPEGRYGARGADDSTSGQPPHVSARSPHQSKELHSSSAPQNQTFASRADQWVAPGSLLDLAIRGVAPGQGE